MIMVTVQMKKEVVANLLCSAIEAGRTYGCGYWAVADKDSSVRPPVLRRKTKKRTAALAECGDWLDDERWYVHWPLFNGGVLGFIEHDDESIEPQPVNHKLDLETIEKGLNVMAQKYPHKFAEVMNDEVDGALGDLFLQCAFFGEEKYA